MTEFYDTNYDVILQLNFSEDVYFDDRENETDKRICRFCGCEESEQHTFNKVAHAISNSLGNQRILTENECDKCNAKFGKTIENELAEYFKHLKPLLRIQGKRGGSKFVQQGKKKTEIKLTEDYKLEVKTNSDEHVQLDHENKKVNFYLKSSAYSPFAVYQAFMKIFLSVLPKEYVKEVEFIKLILNYNELELFTSEIDKRNLDLLKKYILDNAKAIQLFIPGFSLSDLMILRKKDSVNIGGPKFFFVIRIANFAYQFAIPNIGESNPINIPSIFNYFIEKLSDNISPKISHIIEDFSYIDKISPEKYISFSFSSIMKLSEEELNNLKNEQLPPPTHCPL